ncbi:MAG: glycosyltransferase family 2 protein [Acidobacteria bacterium]|nr:glycosyltransferase family 2 protein [Acidobacteriota bacterium]
MTVSVVIPNWNQRELLVSALRSIGALRKPVDCIIETIVVDNASIDGSAEAAEALGATVLRQGSNLGVSRAFNAGIAVASGEFVALVNNDVELSEDWLERLLAALYASAWFAAGKSLDWTDRTRIDGAGDAVCRGGAAWRLGHGRADGPEFEQRRKTFFPSATATLFRKAFFERAGGFEEAFFAYLEDVELGVRAAAAGMEGVYEPAARAYHRGSVTGVRWSAQMVRWMTAHQVLLLAKHYPAGLLLRFARPIAAAQLLWGAMSVSRGRGVAWALGLVDGMRGWRSMRRSLLRSEARDGSSSRLAKALEAAEGEIVRIQRATGWDGYWKWYCRLAWPPAQERA